MGSGACPAEFLAKTLIRPVFEFVRFRVFVRRRGSRVPGRGAASAARQDKNIAGLGGFEGRRIPPQRSLSLWTISQTPRARRMRTHAGGPGPRRGRFRAFHGEEINGSCLDCPCAHGKLPKPTSRVGPQAGRTLFRCRRRSVRPRPAL